MTIDQFLFAAAAIERGIEAFKRAVLERFLGGDSRATARGVIAFILSMIAGLIVAFVLNLNMFASLGAAYALAGTALTGLIVGGGSNMVHRAWDLLGQLATLLDDRIESRLTHG
jgi:xanthosine utilization system XapX-like protein